MTPTVSVVIPAYNGARYLGEALASVRAQDYQPLEIIVVDDGSTDGSAAVARSVPSVRVIEQANAGVAAARNAGLAAATGELLAFLDQDDLWTPHKLAVQVDHLAQHPALGYVLGHVEHFLAPDCAPPAWLRPALLAEARPAYLLGAVLARRWVFDRLGGFATRYAQASDSDWFVRARDAGIPLAMLAQVLLRKRVHVANHSADTRTGLPELLDVVRASVVRRRARGAR